MAARAQPRIAAWRPRIAASAGAGCLLGVAVALLRGDAAEAWTLAPFMAASGVAVEVDLRERRIPNAVTVPGMALALILAAVGGVAAQSLAGLALAGGTMALAWLVGRGRLGLGDVKFSAFVGAVLGGPGAALFLIAGSLIGAVEALWLLARHGDRQATIAYGPCLTIGAVVAAVMYGPLVP